MAETTTVILVLTIQRTFKLTAEVLAGGHLETRVRHQEAFDLLERRTNMLAAKSIESA